MKRIAQDEAQGSAYEQAVTEFASGAALNRALNGKCAERVYSGRSQYDRLIGRDCSRQATVWVRSRTTERKVCEQHAQTLVRKYGFDR